jgi:Tfp pilus assembly protein PilX
MRNRKPFNAKPTNPEAGFAIPIALGFGLVMILLATTSVIRSQNDNISAINKRSTARSLAAAETGISRIQDFLNRNRAASVVKACDAPAAPVAPASGTYGSPSYGTCPDVSPTRSWDVPSKIPNLCLSTFSSSDTSLVNNNNWQDVDAADASQGKFRISSYNVSSGTEGVLTVEGKANVATYGEAMSKIQAKFPIAYPTTEPVASLWTNTTTISGSPKIDSSVVINDTAPCSTSASIVSLATSESQFFKTTQLMPPVLPVPTTTVNTLADISAAVPTKELPRSTDTPDASDSTLYKYVVTNLNGSFKVTPGKKIRLWVEGNIDLSDKIIVNQCDAPVTPATTPPTKVNPNCGPFDVRIYPSDTTSALTLTLNKGTAICDVFFHLPNYGVTFIDTTGTVSSQDCGVTAKTSGSATSENTGIYWVKSWSGGAGTDIVLDLPRATWAKAIAETGLTDATSPLKPLIGPATSWDRQSF